MDAVQLLTAGIDVGSSPRVSAEERLAVRIESDVRRRTGDRIKDLKVEVRRDGVRLQGRCSSFYSKQLAQHAAMPLSRGALTNDIEVA